MKRLAAITSLLVGCGATAPAAVAPPVSSDDGDDLHGAADACPDRPEDEDGFQDDDGCPEADNDGDTVLDVDDLCPCDVEDLDQFEDQDGCPDLDDDRDRIVDACDRCPREPETYNGHCDEDGCPDFGHVCVEPSRILIVQEVQFARGQAEITPEMAPVVDALAQTLLANPQIGLVAVIGETEPREPRAQALARQRAETVLEALVARGIPRERLLAEVDLSPAHDPSEPRDRWRRVRFSIRQLEGRPYDQDAADPDPTACMPSPCPPPSACDPTPPRPAC